MNRGVNITASGVGREASIIGACLIARDSSTVEREVKISPDPIKMMKIPYIENLEKLDFAQLESSLLRNTAGVAVDAVNWPQLYSYAPQTIVRMARGRNHFALQFRVTGIDLRATEMEDNGSCWEDSCCEFFFSAGGKDYYNIEVTCVGSIRIGKGPDRYDRILVDSKEVAKIKRWSSLEKKVYDIEGGNHSWSITLLIPFSVLDLNPDMLPDEIKGNFYKCGDKTAHPHFVSWNPIQTEQPDFHRPEFFGRIILK